MLINNITRANLTRINPAKYHVRKMYFSIKCLSQIMLLTRNKKNSSCTIVNRIVYIFAMMRDPESKF